MDHYKDPSLQEDVVVFSKQPEMDQLGTYPLVGELDPADKEAISPFLKTNIFPDRYTILRQGQSSEIFHILLEGQLDIFLENDRKVKVASLEPGQFVGEMSCLTGGAVSATVVAIGTVHTLCISREGVLLLMDRSASFRNHMIQAMIKRIEDSNDRVVEEYTRSFAVMRQLELERKANYGRLVGSSAFMCKLREQMIDCAAHAEPLCIMGEKGVGKFHTAYEIHRRSNRSEYPIISMDGENFNKDDWEIKLQAAKEGTIVIEHVDGLPIDLLNELLHPHADTRVILTAYQKPNIDVREIELVPLRERTEDIPELVHELLTVAGIPDPEEAISNEAMHMIAAFPFLSGNIQELKQVIQDSLIVSGGKTIQTKHLRFGTRREPGTRPNIGLALGSGSSRGAAHVGVLKVLEQEGIPVDIIAGTSVGAFIGALYAGGQPISAFEKVLPTVRWSQLVQLVMPPKALVSNLPMARFVEKYIGPVEFKDLSIPFAAMASDALTGEACILNKGKVAHAICASTAIPGVMKPVQHDNRLLVDGAVVHPVPVALAKSMGADIVIAVDLSEPAFTKREPKNFVASIVNTIEIMSKKIVTDELQLADVVLTPQVESQQISFKASAFNIKMGEKAAREALDLIKSKLS